jgi:hypothetical protein
MRAASLRLPPRRPWPEMGRDALLGAALSALGAAWYVLCSSIGAYRRSRRPRAPEVWYAHLTTLIVLGATVLFLTAYVCFAFWLRG